MKKSFLVGLVILGAFAVSSSLSIAHEHGEGKGHGNSHEAGPCKMDRETLCKGVEQGHGEIEKCFKENESKLSESCKANLSEKKEAMKDVKEACHADAEKFCGDMGKGHGKMMKCMKKNKENLSEACKTELKEMRAKRK